MFPMRDMMWECCFDPILFEYCLEVDVSTESRSMKRLKHSSERHVAVWRFRYG